MHELKSLFFNSSWCRAALARQRNKSILPSKEQRPPCLLFCIYPSSMVILYCTTDSSTGHLMGRRTSNCFPEFRCPQKALQQNQPPQKGHTGGGGGTFCCKGHNNNNNSRKWILESSLSPPPVTLSRCLGFDLTRKGSRNRTLNRFLYAALCTVQKIVPRLYQTLKVL